MIAVESVVMQRNLGPDRFCGGEAPVTDFSQPNTYAPNPDWPACKSLVENEYRRMLGVQKVIWIPTGVIEDSGTFRGALGTHIQVPEFRASTFHTPASTRCSASTDMRTTSCGSSPPTLWSWRRATVSAAATNARRTAGALARCENHQRLERAYDIISRQTTESGQPIRVVRIPTPVLTFDVSGPGDGIYDYFAAYDRWEDGSTTPRVMLGLWASSYVNYVPTNDLVIVSKFWKPGRSLRDQAERRRGGRRAQSLFPGPRGRAGVLGEREPRRRRNELYHSAAAGEREVRREVRLGEGSGRCQVATLYAAPTGDPADWTRGPADASEDIYLERLAPPNTRPGPRVSEHRRWTMRSAGWTDGNRERRRVVHVRVYVGTDFRPVGG